MCSSDLLTSATFQMSSTANATALKIDPNNHLHSRAPLRRLEAEDSVRICRRSARNSSGVVGVSKVTVIAPSGSEYHFWQATWSPESGRRRCIKFSIRRHGERRAFDLAVEARQKGAGLP